MNMFKWMIHLTWLHSKVPVVLPVKKQYLNAVSALLLSFALSENCHGEGEETILLAGSLAAAPDSQLDPFIL